MINFDGSRLIMNGSGVELIAEIGLVISRLVSDFDCPPELLMDVTKTAIKIGQERGKQDDEQCFSYSARDDSLPEEFKKELAKCSTPKEAREVIKKYNIPTDEQNNTTSVEEMLFKKMFGDLMNE